MAADRPVAAPLLSVVVPVRNGAETIGPCLDALFTGQDGAPPFEVIVVDNGSTDGTAEIAARHPVTVVAEPEPGVSNARNRGTAESRGELLAFLDADCIVEPGWAAAIAEPFADPTVGCVAGELAHVHGESVAERQAVRKLGSWQRFAISSNPPFAVTANAAYRRTVLDRIGGFDPSLVRAQDVELGARFAREKAGRMVLAERAIARHRHHTTHLGFFRQQLGWAYGAGLVAAKHRALHGDRSPRPQIRHLGLNVKGLWLVGMARARGRARPEWVHDAWFDLLQQIGWFFGANAGMLRGAWIWRGGEAAGAER